LTDDFLAQYRFNIESTPDYLDLQRIMKESEEALVPWDKGDTIDSHSDADGRSSKKNEESKKRVRLTGLSSIKKSLRKLIVVRGMHPRIWLRELSISRNNLLKWSSQCTS
jgi:hypothetical protein